MIGQERLIQFIQQQIENDTFPRFSIIVGQEGSGKKTLARNIVNMMGKGVCIEYGISIESVRNMILEAHRLNGLSAVYIIPDADTMSVQAKNALLKVTEEPPNGAHFIMTLEDSSNTLDTILSRGTVYYMDRYTPDEIERYVRLIEEDEIELCRELCDTPGEVNTLSETGIAEFYNYVELAVNNIQTVSLANALKMSNKIALKAEDEGYDLKLFWKAFMRVCSKEMMREPEYVEWIRITSKAVQRLRVRGINKQMLFDNWIFDIRDWR